MRAGERLELELTTIAQGGHCVGRHQGQVVFVWGGIPGERVLAEIVSAGSRYARAAVVSVLRADADRVEPPCPNAGRCGGCDFQHISLDRQRALKAQVVGEQLRRLAGIEWTGAVEEIAPTLGYRVRMRYLTDPAGRLGLRAHRSHEVVALPAEGCRIAHPAMPHQGVHPAGEYLGVVSREGAGLLPSDTAEVVTESVAGRTFQVAAGGFWQSHLTAAEFLTPQVLDALRPARGEVAFDLYCGVGVFAAALAEAGAEVWGVEGDKTAVGLARRNVGGARFVVGAVERALGRLPGHADLVVLDPPRAGAGAAVIGQLAALKPRAIAYVSCDPATLARDLAAAQQAGLRIASVRAFDLFPMTQHVECLAVLTPGGADQQTEPPSSEASRADGARLRTRLVS